MSNIHNHCDKTLFTNDHHRSVRISAIIYMPNPAKPTTEPAYNRTNSSGTVRVTKILYQDQKQ